MSGQLTSANAEAAGQSLAALLENGPPRVDFNLSDLAELTHAGTAAFYRLLTAARARKMTVTVHRAAPGIQHVLRAAGVDRLAGR